jgi:DNA polymerase III delta subunit
MPILNLKMITQEINKNQYWSHYWVSFNQNFLIQSLIDLLKKNVCNGNTYAYQAIDGSKLSVDQLWVEFQSLPLMCNRQLFIVRDIHDKGLSEHLQKGDVRHGPLEEHSCVVVWIAAKPLDQRKKLSKLIVEKMAVIPEIVITEQARNQWIDWLSHKLNVTVSPEENQYLQSLEPWSLDLMYMELQKWLLAHPKHMEPVLGTSKDSFIQAFLQKDQRKSFTHLKSFCEDFFLNFGLLVWNMRQIQQVHLYHKKQIKLPKNFYPTEYWNSLSQLWTVSDLQKAQGILIHIDFQLKHTNVLSDALMIELITTVL